MELRELLPGFFDIMMALRNGNGEHHENGNGKGRGNGNGNENENEHNTTSELGKVVWDPLNGKDPHGLEVVEFSIALEAEVR